MRWKTIPTLRRQFLSCPEAALKARQRRASLRWRSSAARSLVSCSALATPQAGTRQVSKASRNPLVRDESHHEERKPRWPRKATSRQDRRQGSSGMKRITRPSKAMPQAAFATVLWDNACVCPQRGSRGCSHGRIRSNQGHEVPPFRRHSPDLPSTIFA